MGRPHAPKVDHPYVFSVSQLETFDLCNRKWAFDKIDKLEGAPNEAAELGQRVHDVLEQYLDKAVPIDRNTREGKIAFPGIKHLPLPRTPGMRVEKWFVLKFGVAAYRGLKDVEIIVVGKEPIVLDHKSTRNFRWKKTKQQLLKNLQAGIYAADAMKKTGFKTVILKWVYYKTEGKPVAEPVIVRITKQQVEEILSNADEIAQRMVYTLLTSKRALDVIPNYTACEAFGGCPYKEHCVRKPSSVLRSIMAQKKAENMAGSSTSEFLANLKNRNAGKKTSEEKKAAPSVKLKDVETVKINPPEREETEQPRPPSPKKIAGKWINAEWDEAAWKWFYPGEEEAAKEEKAAAAAKKVEDKKGGKVTTTSSTKTSKPAVQEIDEDAEDETPSEDEEDVQEVASEPEKKPAKTETTAAKKVAEVLKESRAAVNTANTAAKTVAEAKGTTAKSATTASKSAETKKEPVEDQFLIGLTPAEKHELVKSLSRASELLAKHLDATIPF